MRWLIVEDALRNKKGHWFELVTSFAHGFRQMGDDVVVLADTEVQDDIRKSLPAIPILPASIWHRMSDGSSLVTRYSRVFSHSWKTWRIMRRYLATNSEFDAIFVPTVSLHHLLAWVALIKRVLPNRTSRVLLFFVILPIGWDSRHHKPVPDGSPTATVLFRILRWLQPEIRSGKVVLGAETQAMREAIESLSGLPCALFPLPVVPVVLHKVPVSNEHNGIEMACYGFSRSEKGTDILQEAIEIYRRRFPSGRARFTIQWTEDFLNAQGQMVVKSPDLMRDPQVRFITRYMSDSDYAERLARTHVMLLPYRLGSYRFRGSRVAIQAVVNGIPAIATQGSTLADIVASHGAGLVCRDGDPESMALAIRKMEEQYDILRQRAQEKERAAARQFSFESFRRIFLSPGLSVAPRKQPKRESEKAACTPA